MPPRPSLFIMWQKSRSAPPFIPSSHFSLKRERRGGGIRVIEARNLTTAGGRKDRRRESGPIASPSSSSSFRRRRARVSLSLRRSKVIIEGETRHEGGLARSHARAAAAPARLEGGERERWSCEIFARTKANRSIPRSAFLFESGPKSFQ